MDSKAASSSRTHFHIRWVAARRLDWERFATSPEATTRARELAGPSEKFEIEEFDETCSQCGRIQAPVLR